MDVGSEYQIAGIMDLSNYKEDKNPQQNVQTQTLPNIMKLAITLVMGALLLSIVGAPKPDMRNTSHTDQVVKAYSGQSNRSEQHAPNESRPTKGTDTGNPPASVPAAPASTVTAKVFDANDPSTWPHCAADEFVRADTGQCSKKATTPASAPTTAPASSSVVQSATNTGNYPCPADIENAHGMTYVFCHESGGRRTVLNSEGCIGIGQACPASKLYAACPTLDLDCQINFFTNYAAARYGGWSGAEAFWRSNRWW